MKVFICAKNKNCASQNIFWTRIKGFLYLYNFVWHCNSTFVACNNFLRAPSGALVQWQNF
jgi:hypothetical protein